ncbi:Periplasmic oligopeptide-binding protein precursor [Serratia entomophila]|uniref:Oligopeptide ABC transporter substrate-binding protein OppA n=1 Tax=Serratia entomophila TaxID=42906 RepID=A0ABY5CLB1_9GAMM|nr:ABC transporter substrate-binding protein [Serratia entomophila]UIW16274.1 oligopeptide ABC transporter substrate-binding protein OppA [Serratia entomophila]USU98832.1 oligopeptide ABC transporter substrate-binding protein OppA [Serratia entomophila]CAI0706151.1 Periplasmic oligopeptide-binding protein precursor [Serratia entomophila]CAI0796326.1 Periplasmic oligopeptide-binding protein precursor [Serratia entomophila]CAI0807109.1 Periplasmic oligopeptide-binding protein precursor [Serratia
MNISDDKILIRDIVVKHSFNTKILAGLIVCSLSPVAGVSAAEVPAGVKLAETQELVRANGYEPATLDPNLAESNVEFYIFNDLFEGLLRVGKKGEVIPALAEKWEQQGNVWTFHLRPQAKWSNGDPVTAGDFVYSWRRLTDPKTASPYGSYLASAYVLNAAEINAGSKPPSELGVRALDAHTLQVTLAEPNSYLLKQLVHFPVLPVNQKVVEKYGKDWTQPAHFVGNGAFRLSQWVVNEKLVVERNPQYWDNANTRLNKVTFLPLQGFPEVARFRAGEIELGYTTPPELYQRLKKTLGDEQLVTYPLLSTSYFAFNNQQAPFNDVRVRQALNLALDKDIIAGKVLGYGQQPAWTFTPTGAGGYSLKAGEAAGWTREQRLAQAQKLLAEAGFNAANPLRFTLLYSNDATIKKIVIASSAMWKKNLGVEARLQSQERKVTLDSINRGQYSVAFTRWLADYNDPSTFLNVFRSASSENSPKYRNGNYDRILHQATAAQTPQQVQHYFQQAEDLLAADTPVAPVYYEANATLVKPYVKGIDFTRQGALYDKNAYIVAH